MSICIYIFMLNQTALQHSNSFKIFKLDSKKSTVFCNHVSCLKTKNIGYSIFEGSDVGRQDGQTNGVRLTSGPFGTFWGPYPLSPRKIVNLAQLLHGQKLRTDKQTNKHTHKQTNTQTNKQTLLKTLPLRLRRRR